jgi:hypothetical protein
MSKRYWRKVKFVTDKTEDAMQKKSMQARKG